MELRSDGKWVIRPVVNTDALPSPVRGPVSAISPGAAWVSLTRAVLGVGEVTDPFVPDKAFSRIQVCSDGVLRTKGGITMEYALDQCNSRAVSRLVNGSLRLSKGVRVREPPVPAGSVRYKPLPWKPLEERDLQPEEQGPTSEEFLQGVAGMGKPHVLPRLDYFLRQCMMNADDSDGNESFFRAWVAMMCCNFGEDSVRSSRMTYTRFCSSSEREYACSRGMTGACSAILQRRLEIRVVAAWLDVFMSVEEDSARIFNVDQCGPVQCIVHPDTSLCDFAFYTSLDRKDECGGDELLLVDLYGRCVGVAAGGGVCHITHPSTLQHSYNSLHTPA
jgi:hypothetical protein